MYIPKSSISHWSKEMAHKVHHHSSGTSKSQQIWCEQIYFQMWHIFDSCLMFKNYFLSLKRSCLLIKKFYSLPWNIKISPCIVILTLNLFFVHYKIVVFLLTYLYQRDEISREYIVLTSSKDSTRPGPFLFGLSLQSQLLIYCLTVVSKTLGKITL